MTVAIMQPYLFPYPGYFRLVHAADTFVVYGEAQYIRRGYVNRNRLCVAGKEQWFTLPVERGRQTDAIDERAVSAAEMPRWRERFVRTVGQAYAKTPFLSPALALAEAALATTPGSSIGEVSRASVAAVADYVGLGDATTFVDSAALDYDRTADAQGKILGMCRALGATRYVNAAGGRELYDAAAFAAEGIDLRFVGHGATLPPPYRPDLSILDALCKFDPSTLHDVLSDYHLDA